MRIKFIAPKFKGENNLKTINPINQDLKTLSDYHEETLNTSKELVESSLNESKNIQNQEFNNIIGSAMEKLRVLKNKLLVKTN